MADKVNKDDKSRIIYIQGSINEDKAEKVITQLFDLEIDDPLKDILIYIDSYGGHVDSFFAIHDAIKMTRCDVSTVCFGKAMSCAQMILMSGTKGKRFITPNSRVLIHELSGGYYGYLREVDVHVSSMKELQNNINKLILKYTNINKSTLKEFLLKDTYLSAHESLKYGIVDHIITSPKILYDNINV